MFFPYGAVETKDPETGEKFEVNGHWLK